MFSNAGMTVSITSGTAVSYDRTGGVIPPGLLKADVSLL